jgi:hypothetical protein
MLQKLNAVQNHASRVGSSFDLKKYVSHSTISLQPRVSIINVCRIASTYGMKPPIKSPKSARIAK